MSIEQRIRHNLKAAAGELVVPDPMTVATKASPGRGRSGLWFAVAGVAAALALAIPILAGWFSAPEPQPSATPATSSTVPGTTPPSTSQNPAQETLGETTVGDFVLTLNADRVGSEKPPTATVTLVATPIEGGEPTSQLTVGDAGGFFWHTVSGPDGVCGFVAGSIVAGTEIGVSILLSPSIGCSDIYRFTLDETGELAPGPEDAEAVTTLFVQAWVVGAEALLEALASPEVVDQVGQLPAPVNPVLDSCEGAAGSLYCTFQDDAGHFIVRVSNMAPYQVTEVRTDG